MGRKRSFDEAEVVARCAGAFVSTGYEGTSIDDLMTASGLQRGSLYQAFGSKRGLFLEALRRLGDPSTTIGLDLLLVALLELAPRDETVREVCATRLTGDTPPLLGARLLDRAGISTHARSEGITA
ncbi:TetR/AcrR family transcriptional regulator [Agromyces soli]